MKLLPKAICSLACFLLLLGCGDRRAPGTANPSNQWFTVQDTGLHWREGTDSPMRARQGAGMYWLDDHRLLAVASMPSSGGGRVDVWKEPKAIYIWDTTTRSAQKYRDVVADGSSQFCLANGYVRYITEFHRDHDGEIVYWEGPFGSEKQFQTGPRWGPQAPSDPVSRDFENWLDCDTEPTRDALRPEHRKGWDVRLLRKQDGYLLVGKAYAPNESPAATEDQAINLVRPDSPAPIPVAITEKEMELAAIEYSQYSGEYIITPMIPPSGHARVVTWPLDVAPIVYLLKPDGGVKKQAFPLGVTWFFGFPTKAGFFFPGTTVRTRYDRPGARVYRDGGIVWLGEEEVRTAAPSPDGCKVGVAVVDRSTKIIGIRIFDFCPSGRL